VPARDDNWRGVPDARGAGAQPLATGRRQLARLWHGQRTAVLAPRAGLAIAQGVSALVGLENLTDETYATHLNALNPFTRQRINEIGRSYYAGLEWGF